MTTAPDPTDLPESFEAWPAEVQHRFLREYHALYFPRLTPDQLPAD